MESSSIPCKNLWSYHYQLRYVETKVQRDSFMQFIKFNPTYSILIHSIQFLFIQFLFIQFNSFSFNSILVDSIQFLFNIHSILIQFINDVTIAGTIYSDSAMLRIFSLSITFSPCRSELRGRDVHRCVGHKAEWGGVRVRRGQQNPPLLPRKYQRRCHL